MALEEEEQPGIPEWVVTFGDMMSLLLTFFIMLASFSEIKEEDKYQAMVESIRRRFGYVEAVYSPMPGDIAPRNSVHEELAAMGRAERDDMHNGGDKVSAPTGEYPQVRIIRPGTRTAVGSVFLFDEGQIALTDVQRSELDTLIQQMAGKPQKIEVRGHASLRPLSEGGGYQENWAVAYERAKTTMEYLVEQGIPQYRIRLAVAGPWEPFASEADPDRLRLNPRVEVFLLDEITHDPQSTNNLHPTEAPAIAAPTVLPGTSAQSQPPPSSDAEAHAAPESP